MPGSFHLPFNMNKDQAFLVVLISLIHDFRMGKKSIDLLVKKILLLVIGNFFVHISISNY